jgi:hypothetical protein
MHMHYKKQGAFLLCLKKYLLAWANV